MNWTLLLSENTDINERREIKDADFDARLRKARGARKNSHFDKKDRILESGKTKALRIGSEIIIATAVGGGIGFSIDSWLSTKPWFLIVFLLLGNAAGLWNVFRLTRGHSYRIGFENDKIHKNTEELQNNEGN